MQKANKVLLWWPHKISCGAAELSHICWWKWVFAKGQLEGNINESVGNQAWLCFMKRANNLLGRCGAPMRKLYRDTCNGGNACVLPHSLFPVKTERPNWWNEISFQMYKHDQFVSSKKINSNIKTKFIFPSLKIGVFWNGNEKWLKASPLLCLSQHELMSQSFLSLIKLQKWAAPEEACIAL